MLSCGAFERSEKEIPYIESIVEPCVSKNQKYIFASFEITVIIFKAYKKCKSPIQKGFLKGRLIKTSFFLSVLKMAKETRETSKVYMCKSN